MLLIPILASVSFRQLPWDTVDFRGQWETVSTYIAWAQTTMYLRGWGARSQSSWAGIYLKLEFRARIIPILASVGFRGAPCTSVGYGKPPPHIVGMQTTKYEGGAPEAEISAPIFT